jgi:hypothetical protein
VAAQVFSDEELERLRSFPEIGRDELFRFFTLTPACDTHADTIGRHPHPAHTTATLATLHLESAFQPGRLRPSTSLIVPAGQALSLFHTPRHPQLRARSRLAKAS